MFVGNPVPSRDSQTDEASMQKAVYDAIEAMEQRRITPVNAAEDAALMGAEVGVQMLIAEMAAKYV